MQFKRILKTSAKVLLGLLLLALAVAAVGLAYLEHGLYNPVEPAAPPTQAQRPRPSPNPLRNADFGDLHVHTALSLDANIFDTRNGPRTAYQFAKGAAITLPGSGIRQQLLAPLDFAAVTDHAEGMGPMHQCFDRQGSNYWSLDCIGVRHQVPLLFARLFAHVQQNGARLAQYNPSLCGPAVRDCAASVQGVWQDMQAAAREHYEPGYFSTFNGFEYSPTLVRGGMLHRNVIFRGEAVPT
ncbi:MAG: DUF3604 domain-containing protein, partial [Rhodoferax sp.]